jgi:exopolyphosphatase/guanosine-5'-triphosphate,3'-diphosphate pyrophosphatase
VEDGLTRSIVSFIDIGSNSVRLLTAQLRGGGFTAIREEKETIRLGDQVFLNGFLKQSAMRRGVAAVNKFNKIAHGLNAEKVIAVATSAVRDASNQKEFLGMIKNETGVDVHVVSGREEARLIFLGVSSGVKLGQKNALFIDIGGGSTELIIGNRSSHRTLSSLNVGAIRLTNLFTNSGMKEVEDETYENMCSYVRAELTKANPQNWGKLFGAYGSSGTIINLTEMANGQRLNGASTLKLKELGKISDALRSLSLPERRKYPNINPERADIIVGGAAILETIMKELKVSEIRASDRGLNYGLLVDQMSQAQGGAMAKRVTRESSILDLAAKYSADDAHCENVTRLAGELYDSLRETEIIKTGEGEREFLTYASMLHDVGNAIAYRDHNIHGEYLIKNTELLGFDQSEIAVIASIVRYHMKRTPTHRDLVEAGFSKIEQKTVKTLSALLRIAENLDRSHLGHVKKAEFVESGDKMTLLIYADADVDVELWGMKSIQDCFEGVFGKKLKVDVLPVQLDRI